MSVPEKVWVTSILHTQNPVDTIITLSNGTRLIMWSGIETKTDVEDVTRFILNGVVLNTKEANHET